MSDQGATTDPHPKAAAVEDQWVDDLMPSGFDWVAVVREHPYVALSVAALGGFLLGRFQGHEIVEAASDLAASKVTSSVDRLLDFGG